jgi:hypothetical protein
MLPRFAVEAHLQRLFADADASPVGAADAVPATDTTEPARTGSAEPSPIPVRELGLELSPERRFALDAQNQAQHDYSARNGEPNRSIKRGGYQRTSDLWVSLTDPDAVLMKEHNHGVHLRYRDHYLVDGGKARISVGVLVTAADVIENMPFLDMLWRA